MINMERKLVTIRKVKNIIPIENADKIELAIVDGWQVVTKKGEFEDSDSIYDCVDKGEILYNYMMAEVKRLYKKGTIGLLYNDIMTFQCYSNSYISELANYALEQGDCEIAEITQKRYDKKKEKWITIVSLRSKKNGVDVSKIAQAYGGGGHRPSASYVEE